MVLAGTIKVQITNGDSTQVRRVLCPKTGSDFRYLLAKWLGSEAECTVTYEDNEKDEVTLGSCEWEWNEAHAVFDAMGPEVVPKFKVVVCNSPPPPDTHELQKRILTLENEMQAIKALVGETIFNDTVPWGTIEAKLGSKHIPLLRYLMQCEGPPPLNQPQSYVTRQQYEEFVKYFPLATLTEDLDFLIAHNLVIVGLTTEQSEVYLASRPKGSFVIRPSRRYPRSLVVTMKADNNAVTHRIIQLRAHPQFLSDPEPRTIRKLAEELLQHQHSTNEVLLATSIANLTVAGYK